jgi:hypothetical protein
VLISVISGKFFDFLRGLRASVVKFPLFPVCDHQRKSAASLSGFPMPRFPDPISVISVNQCDQWYVF